MKKNKLRPKSSSEGQYYQIVRSNSWLSRDVRENFVYALGETLFDSREIDYWCDVQGYQISVNDIDKYCEHYVVEVVPVSKKTVILAGLELCYADRA